MLFSTWFGRLVGMGAELERKNGFCNILNFWAILSSRPSARSNRRELPPQRPPSESSFGEDFEDSDNGFAQTSNRFHRNFLHVGVLVTAIRAPAIRTLSSTPDFGSRVPIIIQ